MTSDISVVLWLDLLKLSQEKGDALVGSKKVITGRPKSNTHTCNTKTVQVAH